MFGVFFKQKTAYGVRISDWGSDVCSSDLHGPRAREQALDAGTQKTGLPILPDRPIPEQHRRDVTLAGPGSRPVKGAEHLHPAAGAAFGWVKGFEQSSAARQAAQAL